MILAEYWQQILTIGFAVLGGRTLCFWLQQWQQREYRWDRLKDHLETREGTKKLFNLWFFPGILPRPHISGRILLIFLLFAGISTIFFWQVLPRFPLWGAVLLWERTIWLWVFCAVLISKIPVSIVQKRLFARAEEIMKQADPAIIRVGLSGSYGKSSTKELLVHLLRSLYGEDAVLFNPANQNNEVAIARLICRQKKWLQEKREDRRFLVVETGAYKKGEVARACSLFLPQFGLITGLNTQHLSLFGSVQNVKEAETELAVACTGSVYYNADSPLLVEAMTEVHTARPSHAISTREEVHQVRPRDEQTEFVWQGMDWVLPWGGGFFVQNALLALTFLRDMEVSLGALQKSLRDIPPLQRALRVEKLSTGGTILRDLYSANPNGVLGAVAHLGRFPGKKIFIGIPLIELGEDAERVHEELFHALARAGAEVFWLKGDFAHLGKEICGKRFHGKDMKKLKELLSPLHKNDAVLLESRLPKYVEHLLPCDE